MKNKLGLSLTLISLILFGISIYSNNKDIKLPCLLFGYAFGFASIPINLHYLNSKLWNNVQNAI